MPANTMVDTSRSAAATGAGPATAAPVTPAPWVLFTRVESLTPAGATASITVEESVDGFVADVRPVLITDAVAGTHQQEGSLVPRERPTSKIGTAGCQLRSRVVSLSAGATVVYTTLLQQS